jgi:hypothetical protein
MSNVGLPADVIEEMYERAMSHPVRGNRRKSSARPESKTGLKGAHSDGRGKFSARVMVEGKRKTLGHFCTPEEAHQTYVDFCISLGLLP